MSSASWWASVRQAAPGAIRVLVHGEISDNADLGNPESDAEATARLVDQSPDWPRLPICKNEIRHNTDSRDLWNVWVDYQVRWLRRCHQLGLNGVMGQINSGHPYVSLIDSVDQWQWLAPVEAEMENGDYWGLHEYWNEAGPLANWPWTAGRHMRCPTTHKIILDECGYDYAVGRTNVGNQGWKGKLTGEQYVGQLVEYHQMITDPRVKGTALFLLDFDNNHWQSFDVWPIRDRLIARRAEFGQVHPLATMPYRLTKPIASDRITQTFAQHKANNPLGGWGVDWSAVSGTPVVAAAEGVVDRVEDQGTSGYGKWLQVNHYWGFTRYAHLSRQDVAKGTRLAAGQQVGLSGNTGNSTAGHLHFEVIPFNSRVWSYRVDPIPFIGTGGVPVPTPAPPIAGAPDAAMIERLRNAAWNAIAANLPVRYNPNAAFAVKAREMRSGAPITNELDVANYREQGFAIRILAAPIGDWERIFEVAW